MWSHRNARHADRVSYYRGVGGVEHGALRAPTTPVTSVRRERLERFRTLRRESRLGAIRFESLVVRALDELPVEFRKRIDNVAVIVADRPSSQMLRSLGMGPSHTLLGLYQGIPLHQRGTGYSMVAPDRITIFREPILERCSTEEQVLRQVRATVLHEIGHHFGLSERELR